MKPEPYDVEDLYEREIVPLVGKIVDICREHRIPLIVDVVYAQDETGDTLRGITCLNWPGRCPREIVNGAEALWGDGERIGAGGVEQ